MTIKNEREKRKQEMEQGTATKICKHCKSEIPLGAKVCPQCRKKQGMGCLPKVLIAIVVLGLIGAIFGDSDNDSDSKKVAESNTVTETKSADKTEKEVAKVEDATDTTESVENSNAQLTVGSTFEKNGLKITVNDANLDYYQYIDDEYGLYAPADGKRLIMASFTFENTGKSDAYVSIYDFDCYADNTSCDQAFISDDNGFINGNISPGRNVSFQAYYEVPINAQAIELEYETNIWTNEKATIKLQ